MPIRKLSKEVAQGIAAGEVVERPSSAVKELIENSIDAGATQIEISIEAAGKRLIEVSDNGYGIPDVDIPFITSRYSTSKLIELKDLDRIKTLGFRGEAIASIAAVSRFELVTRAQEEDIGTRLIVEGGEVKDQVRIGAAAGTTVKVRDLFFNVPARLKFLKSDVTEKRRIAQLISRYAIAYPQIRFNLMQDGKSTIQTNGSGDFREAFLAVHGVDWARQMIWVDGAGASEIQVRGLISPPSLNRSNRREIVLFINGRWIQDASLAAAIMQAYHTLLMVGRYPIVYLLINIPQTELDVNVHPGKIEVRFTEPNLVFGVVQRVLRANLLGQAPSVEPHFSSTWSIGSEGLITSFDTQAWGGIESQRTQLPSEGNDVRAPDFTTGQIPLLRVVGQVGATYLVAEGPDGVYLIDQHAAHERILFEEMSHAQASGISEGQVLLTPETIEFKPDEVDLLSENLKILKMLGFDLEPFGGATFKVRAIPVIVQHLGAERALRAVIEDIEEDETPLANKHEERIIARVCKRAAIKAGQILSLTEQEKLVHDLERCEAPRTCPHGRPTMIHFPVALLERQFGRRN